MSTPMMTRSSLRRRKSTAAAGKAPWLLREPVAFDQVLDNEGDRAALEAGDAGEVGAEMGCFVRMRFRTMRRLMSRTPSEEARWTRELSE